jgi:dihydroflavonol-4-reductase
MGRLAFVTGATGFIGRHLVDELVSHGWRVRALVRPTSDTRHLLQTGAELWEGDLTDLPRLAAGVLGADAVFHLAGLTAARTEVEYERANARGTEALVRAVRGSVEPRTRHLVYLSSYAAAGPSAKGSPRDRGAAPEPLTAYGRTKLAGESIASEAEGEGVEVVVIRAPVVYGPGDRALLPYFRLIRWGLAPVPGGVDRRLHLIYAPDLAQAVRRAADAPGGTYAVAEPAEHGWDDVVRTIALALERRPVRISIPAKLVRSAAAVTEAIASASGRAVPFNREKAEEMLAPAWTCDLAGSEILLPEGSATPLEVGIDATIRWYFRQGWL